MVAIKAYQLTFSRIHGRTCLFAPSCSHRALLHFKHLGFTHGLSATRQQLNQCKGDYSLRLNDNGAVELLTHTGSVVAHGDINPVIRDKLLAFDSLVVGDVSQTDG